MELDKLGSDFLERDGLDNISLQARTEVRLEATWRGRLSLMELYHALDMGG